jgi:hypothetical protein
MAKAKHSHERHSGGRGRHLPKTPPGERELRYGTSDRTERTAKAELRGLGGFYGPGVGLVGLDNGTGGLTGVDMLHPAQFGGGGPMADGGGSMAGPPMDAPGDMSTGGAPSATSSGAP